MSNPLVRLFSYQCACYRFYGGSGRGGYASPEWLLSGTANPV
ncbi:MULTISPECIES: hypothetical protein [Photorhabdus]|nr:hypothetical protein [Photorhabdus sp. CRI-LC]